MLDFNWFIERFIDRVIGTQEELDALVDATAAEIFGGLPSRDADGE